MPEEQPAEIAVSRLGLIPWGQVIAVLVALLLGALLPFSWFLLASGHAGSFLVLALVASAVMWIFAPIVEIILIASAARSWTRLFAGGRLIRLGLILVLPAVILCAKLVPYSFEYGIRRRVQQAGGIAQLQDWATKVLQEERRKPKGTEMRVLEDIPEYVQRLQVSWNRVDVDTKYGVVAIPFGRRPVIIVLVVGDRSYTPRALVASEMTRFWDGVYVCKGRSWYNLRNKLEQQEYEHEAKQEVPK